MLEPRKWAFPLHHATATSRRRSGVPQMEHGLFNTSSQQGISKVEVPEARQTVSTVGTAIVRARDRSVVR